MLPWAIPLRTSCRNMSAAPAAGRGLLPGLQDGHLAALEGRHGAALDAGMVLGGEADGRRQDPGIETLDGVQRRGQLFAGEIGAGLLEGLDHRRGAAHAEEAEALD